VPEPIGTQRRIDIDEDVDVAAAQSGDRRALDALLRANYDRMYAVCRRMTGNDADAADACQEALVAVVRNLAKFDRRSRFGTWAYRVAVNASLDELRRRGRRPRPFDTGAAERGDAGQADPYPDPSVTVTDRAVLDKALAELHPDFRAAVVLRDVAGLDYAEIAETLGIPPGTVRSRIARGRAALADRLGSP
jgi:RNA polymerase sigma-70 factor (ECF subfamily)